ncbi:MAG: hypothetical protein IKK85_01460 [Clostridia bacterium]|nr:hypothetical protein [Clostridia bacterium]
MKKLVLFLSVLLCFLFSFSAVAADGAITLEAKQIENEIVLALNISENSKLCTTEIYIEYPEDAVEFKTGSCVAGSAAAELSPYITASVLSDGILKISYTCTDVLTAGGEICTLSFKPKKDATVIFTPEIEHAETFDGKHIRSLSFTAEGCETAAQGNSSNAIIICAVVTALAAAAIIAAAIIKRRKV